MKTLGDIFARILFVEMNDNQEIMRFNEEGLAVTLDQFIEWVDRQRKMTKN